MGDRSPWVGVRRDQLCTLRASLDKVWGLFGVRLLVPSNLDQEEEEEEEDEDDGSTVQVGLHHGGAADQLLIDDLVDRVQQYVDSLCAPYAEKCQRTCSYSRDAYERVLRHRDHVERSSCAVLSFQPSSLSVLVSGKAPCVATALSLLQKLVNSADAEDLHHSHYLLSPSQSGEIESRSRVSGEEANSGGWSISSGCSSTSAAAKASFRRKLESEDSSYDSDFDNSEVSPSCPHQPKQLGVGGVGGVGEHDDVSRTVSDTLGAEFAEYVSSSGGESSSLSCDPLGRTASDAFSLRAVLDDPQYNARVEFALKLGYTEQQVQVALRKLGPCPGQNELLAELIKLGAHSKSLEMMTVGKNECLQQQQPAISQQQQQPSALPSASPVPGVTSSPSSSSVTCGASAGGDSDALVPSALRRDIALSGSGAASQQGSSAQASGAMVQPTLTAVSSLPPLVPDNAGQLRPIVVDGSNVAMSHGNKETYSCRGIKLCVDWFKTRGHKDITVFVPSWRKEASRPYTPINDQEILLELEKERLLVFTPSRFVGGKRLICYDDRYILKLAAETDGVVVSNDNYRDLAQENPEFKKVVKERILMYSFVNDRFMPPDDPLGRNGPTLDNFLRRQPRAMDLPPQCPYGKKCTYGNKCKYYHPERGNQPQKSITERLAENAQKQLQEVKARGMRSRDSSPGELLKGKSLSLPLPQNSYDKPVKKTPLSRTKSTVPSIGIASPPSAMSDGSEKWLSMGQSPVSKSKSVENVAGRGYPPPWMQFQNPPPGARPDEKPDESETEGANMHRKLQRQLTLNPAYDPRLRQLQTYYVPQPPTQHRRVVSRVASQPPPAWGGEGSNSHQGVTRIASAPDSYCPWLHQQQPMQRLNSTSDPQLNLYGVGLPLPNTYMQWPHSHHPHPPHLPHPQQQQHPTALHRISLSQDASKEAKRKQIQYHLSYIFPKERVQAVLSMYPDETNPDILCAALVTMTQ